MKILVPVDGSHYTKRMLGYLAAHDEWFGGGHEYTVMHCVPTVPSRAAAVIDRDTLKAKKGKVAFAIPCPARRTSGNWVLDPVPLHKA